jgi:tRNA(fMet)-specific endonuclease VapC
MVVLDTDHRTLLQTRDPATTAVLAACLAQVDPGQISTTIITYEEQVRGWLARIARAKTGPQMIAAYGRLKRHWDDFRSHLVLDFDERAAAEFQRLRGQRIRIGTMDLKISAIVLVNDATLLTRNLVDFRQVPGLKAEDWTT